MASVLQQCKMMSAEKKNAVRETFSKYSCGLLVTEIVNLKERKEDLISNKTNNWLRSLQVVRKGLVSVLWS